MTLYFFSTAWSSARCRLTHLRLFRRSRLFLASSKKRCTTDMLTDSVEGGGCVCWGCDSSLQALRKACR